jgi:serine protease Do
MNTKILGLAALVAAAAAVSAATPPADAPDAPKKEHREIRIIKTHDMKETMEMTTFLGVETAPASPTLGAQLGLAEGTGLVVMNTVPGSPAFAALQRHDILLKVDDQILVETRQLAVLIHNKKDGDEVTLTFLRAGKEQTAKVKLAKKEMPKQEMSKLEMPRMLMKPGQNMKVRIQTSDAEEYGADLPPDVLMGLAQPHREDADQVLGYLHEKPGYQIVTTGRGTGVYSSATVLNPGSSVMVMTGDDGSLEMSIDGGKKSVVAKDKAGKKIFSGPANTHPRNSRQCRRPCGRKWKRSR